MTRATAPKRGEELTPLGKATIRFSKYLESITSSVNTSEATTELIGSYFPGGAALGELSKRIDSLENSNPIALNGFTDEILKGGRTQDSLIAELLSSNQTVLAFIEELLKSGRAQDSLIAELLSGHALMLGFVSELQAAFEINYVEVDDTYTASKFDQVIYCDTTANGDFTVTIPDPDLAFQPITVMNVTGSASTVTVATAAGSIVGATALGDTVAGSYHPRESADEWREY